jgi:hypothetical protein
METARYILSILRASGSVMMSCGPHAFIALRQGGLQFMVQGFKHKGRVQVIYNEGTDLFDITFLRSRKDEIVGTRTGIYFDQLAEVIDNFVEYTGHNYAETVTEWFTAETRVN